MGNVYKKRFGHEVLAKPLIFLVPGLGIEPRRGRPRGILSFKMTILIKAMISINYMIFFGFYLCSRSWEMLGFFCWADDLRLTVQLSELDITTADPT
jgi:hypothetical protein